MRSSLRAMFRRWCCPFSRAALAALGWMLAFGSVVTPVWAEGADSSVAEALFQDGRRLIAEQRYAEACSKFAESERLEPAIGTLLNLATCHAAEGKTASAWSEFTRALSQAQRDNRTDVIELAQARIAELAPKLAKLVLEVGPESEVDGLEVRLDGQVLQKPAWGIVAPIDPGKHAVTASAPGHVGWETELDIASGELRTQAVPKLVEQRPALVQTHVDASAPRLAPPASEESARRGGSSRRAWALGMAGGGLVGVAASVVLGFSAKATYDRAAPHCDASGCDPVGLELRHDAVVRGRVGTVVFGAGVAALAGGAVLWLTAPRPAETNRVSLGLTPRALVARWKWQ
jgi:hypothetical protein